MNTIKTTYNSSNYQITYSDFCAYSFNAKEKDYESGFHYYGSRYYSSELSIWNSTDPMADKYPSLTPYNYCANNPVKLIDPNGKEIWIVGDDGNNYQYKKGNLYTKNGDEYTGDDKFANQVKNDLNTLKDNGMGSEIESLIISSKRHSILNSKKDNTTTPESPDNINNKIGTSSEIKYNPQKTDIDGWYREPVIGLSHEIKHAFDFDKGEYNTKTETLIRFEPINSNIPINPAEEKTPSFINIYGKRVLCNKITFDIEIGEINAINTANKINSNLGSKKPRTNFFKYNLNRR